MSVLALLALSPSYACGGFFCNTDEPVEQSSERILFVEDEERGEVEAHVQIFFQGPAPEFAWVVPVPAVPELFPSSDEVFALLDSATQPRFELTYVEQSECEQEYLYGYPESGYWDYDAAASESSNGVSVVAEEVVGPYETVTLRARSTGELLTWLQDNNFDLPNNLTPALDPYVAEESYFVAMRLANDKTAGDIQPIGMRYPSTSLSIPIKLTSIAAVPDMRVETYVMGAHRAVPESYLHVRINEAAIDWFGGGYNYEDVISQAADEAGGHAFATDYSGSSDVFGDALRDDRYDTDLIAESTTPSEAMEHVMVQFGATPILLSILSEYMPPPEGVEATDFYNCVSCYDTTGDYEWDAVGLADALYDRVVEPLLHVADLVEDNAHLTRLTSSLDAVEMTVDPTFVQNPDMTQTIDHVHSAKVIMFCGMGGPWDGSSRELLFQDGRSVRLPSIDWLRERGMTEFEYMERLSNKAAIVIEQTSASGEPIAIADFNDWADDQANDLSTEADLIAASDDEQAKGCGCSAAGGVGGLGLLPVLGLFALRRRS